MNFVAALDISVGYIRGFINLLEGCKNAGVKKVIFASSGGAVYGEQESFPATESHVTQPASPYGVSKRTGELYLSYYHQTFGLPYLALMVMPRSRSSSMLSKI